MGTVADSSNGTPLSSANVILLKLPDSTFTGAATDSRGKFIFNNIGQGRYNLIISYVGYQKYSEILRIRNRSIDLGTINLIPGELSIEDVEIIGRLTPVIQNADTTQYNADAFKTHKDADAMELVTKMPGITVADGKVKAQGEDVRKVLVDGRQFFGEDPTATLKNLPAEIVDRIQVFDEQTEQARFTGFDDGNTSKTMNVVTRMRIRQGTFGRFTGGYGDNQRYSSTANINLFNNDQRLSLLGQINNISEQNFSREDLMGIFSSGRGGGHGGGGFYSRGGGGSFRGPGGDFLVGTADGLSETKAFGINYSDKYWDKIDLSGSYFINRSDNDAESAIRREYFLPELSGQNYFENNSSSSTNINHRFNMRAEYEIDSMNEISFRPRFSLQQNNGSGKSAGQTFSETVLLNSINNLSGSDLSAINSSAELSYRHKFNTDRRTISLFLNGAYSNNEGDSKYYSENTYYISNAFSDTLDQISDLYRDSRSMSANVTYTEPLGENGMMLVNSEFSFKKDNNDQKRFDVLASGNIMLDSALSNLSDKTYNSRKLGTGYRYRKDELTFNVNLDYNMSTLKNDRQYPYQATAERNFYSLLPSVSIRYRPSRDQDFRLNYRTNNNDPNIEQLQDVLDNSNPLRLSIGNPELKQDYRHSVFLNFRTMSMATLRSIFMMLYASLTDNYIGNNTIIAGRDSLEYRGILLNPGTQLSTPINLNGNFSVGSSIFYSMPAEILKSYLNLNLDINFSRIPGMINSRSGFTNSGNYTFGASVTSNISTDFDFTLSGSSSYNNVKSDLRNDYNQEYFTQNASFRLRSQFWEGIVIDNNMNYQYDSGLPESYNRNVFLWNLSLGKKLFSNNQGEIRIAAYDLLNKGTNIRRYAGDTYIQDTRANTIGRYFILSFIYQLRNFGS